MARDGAAHETPTPTHLTPDSRPGSGLPLRPSLRDIDRLLADPEIRRDIPDLATRPNELQNAATELRRIGPLRHAVLTRKTASESSDSTKPRGRCRQSHEPILRRPLGRYTFPTFSPESHAR